MRIFARWSTLIAVLLVPLACAPKAPPPPDTAADEASLRAAQERELATLASGNVDSMLTNYTDDVVMMPPGEAAVTGTAGVRAWVEAMAKQMTMTGRYDSADVTVSGDLAVVRYTGELTITPTAKGAKPMTEKIKGLHVFRRQPDGGWKIAQDVWNVDPAPTPAK